MKTEIYTWRVSPEVKSALEMEARREMVNVAALLDRVTRQWLHDRRAKLAGDGAGQAKLHAQVAKSIGKIAGKNPLRSQSVRVLLRPSTTRTSKAVPNGQP
jgi:hypothetical protein